jgi:hypothetical protein
VSACPRAAAPRARIAPRGWLSAAAVATLLLWERVANSWRARRTAGSTDESKAVHDLLERLTSGGSEEERRAAAGDIAAHVKAAGAASMEVRRALVVSCCRDRRPPALPCLLTIFWNLPGARPHLDARGGSAQLQRSAQQYLGGISRAAADILPRARRAVDRPAGHAQGGD